MRCLNLGCGQRFHPEWTNLDLHPSSPSVQQWDLQKGLPFISEHFDVVYHSHVLEHFSKGDGVRFLGECFRVLRGGGIVRVAVPDLEQIARLYLEALEKSVGGDPVWQSRYEWLLLEMYDQTVRRSSGGEMLAFLQRKPIPERDFIAKRLGGEFDRIARQLKGPSAIKSRGAWSSLRNLVSRKAVRLVLGRNGTRAYDEGAFRLSGEIHLQMYDRYSLGEALGKSGFSSVRNLGAAESAIPGWASFNLDTEPDGSVYKPDSFYMEAVRA
jgi:SAM-dependent methyltransferase